MSTLKESDRDFTLKESAVVIDSPTMTSSVIETRISKTSTTNKVLRRSRASGEVNDDDKDGSVDEGNRRRPLSQIQVEWSKMAQYYSSLKTNTHK